MADPKQLKKIASGVPFWNEWRRDRWEDANLSAADLSGRDLQGINFQDGMFIGTNFTGADLSYANLSSANLQRADLTDAKLVRTDLRGCDLQKARLHRTNLYQADLTSSDLEGADLRDADLNDASLRWARAVAANFRHCDLAGADLRNANLRRADLSGAKLIDTVFGHTDLFEAAGLEACEHRGPSVLDHATITRLSKRPAAFLRGCGLPDPVIEFYFSSEPIDSAYRSCFISFNQNDSAFVRKLYDDLQSAGVRCWFAPEDMKIGDRIRIRIDDGIQEHDHLLLVLSDTAVASQWVEKEVETAFSKEELTRAPVLFPIRLDDSILRAQSGWAADIKRTRHIGDFSEWRDEEAYMKSLDRLLRDLKI